MSEWTGPDKDRTPGQSTYLPVDQDTAAGSQSKDTQSGRFDRTLYSAKEWANMNSVIGKVPEPEGPEGTDPVIEDLVAWQQYQRELQGPDMDSRSLSGFEEPSLAIAAGQEATKSSPTLCGAFPVRKEAWEVELEAEMDRDAGYTGPKETSTPQSPPTADVSMMFSLPDTRTAPLKSADVQASTASVIARPKLPKPKSTVNLFLFPPELVDPNKAIGMTSQVSSQAVATSQAKPSSSFPAPSASEAQPVSGYGDAKIREVKSLSGATDTSTNAAIPLSAPSAPSISVPLVAPPSETAKVYSTGRTAELETQATGAVAWGISRQRGSRKITICCIQIPIPFGGTTSNQSDLSQTAYRPEGESPSQQIETEATRDDTSVRTRGGMPAPEIGTDVAPTTLASDATRSGVGPDVQGLPRVDTTTSVTSSKKGKGILKPPSTAGQMPRRQVCSPTFASTAGAKTSVRFTDAPTSTEPGSTSAAVLPSAADQEFDFDFSRDLTASTRSEASATGDERPMRGETSEGMTFLESSDSEAEAEPARSVRHIPTSSADDGYRFVGEDGATGFRESFFGSSSRS